MLKGVTNIIINVYQGFSSVNADTSTRAEAGVRNAVQDRFKEVDEALGQAILNLDKGKEVRKVKSLQLQQRIDKHIEELRQDRL